MSLAVIPSPLLLDPASPQRSSMSNEINRLLAAQRLALLGYSRQINSLPIPTVGDANPLSTQALKVAMQSSVESSFTKISTNPQPPSQSALSSVARRKQRIANYSVPSYALGIVSDAAHTPPAPSPSNGDSTSSQSSQTSLNRPVLAPVGVVDMRFLTRQPPTIQKPALENQPKSASKESSVGTPTSPSAPLASGPPPKNQRPKPTAPAAPAAATNGKSNSSTATASNGGNKSDTVDKDALKSKHAFLFRPESQQPTSGPYVRYSPMYHYYHPYRNLHREAIKEEWMRLHPVVERVQPPEEEEAVTPPRRTSGRQKKTNVRGVAARGRDKTTKRGAAAAAVTSSQTNDAPLASPQIGNSRRSRANAAKSRNGARTANRKGGRTSGNAASKRKRAEIEEDDKQTGGKDEGIPLPPPKRPRRGAAALAAIATAEAARDTEEAGSNKDEGSPNEAHDDGEPKTAVKRRMRPNARKTAAARAAAMEAKKQKKRSTEDGEATEDNNDEEGPLESVKDDESVSKPDESQKAETPGADLDLSASVEKDEARVDAELQVDPEAEQDVEPERKTKAARGKSGSGAAKGGSRAKTKRSGFGAQKRAPGLGINTRGTPRGTPRHATVDDETGSLPPDQEDAQVQHPPVGRRNTRKGGSAESALGILVNPPAKTKRVGGGRKSRQDASQGQDSNDIVHGDAIAVDPMLIAGDIMSVSQHTIGEVEPESAVAGEDRMMASEPMIATKPI